jgi:hypothetical protein
MVNGAPSVTISPSSAILDVGQSQNFTSSLSGGTSPYYYQWYLDGTPVPSAMGATWSLVPSATGSYNVYVVITDSLGVNAASNAAAVTVNGALSVTASPSPVLLDVGQCQLFTSSVMGGTFPYSYQWYLNGQAVGTGITYNFFAQAVGPDSIYVAVTDSASSPYTATSNTANVMVNSAPSVDVSPSSGAMDVGQSRTFMATASGGSGTYLSYQWYVDGRLQSSNVSTFVYSSSTASMGTRSITVTVTDSLGVTSPQSSPATVTVNAALTAPALTFLPLTVDRGQTSVLSNSTVISTGISPYSYEWFEMAPGGSYVVMGSGLSFSFVTSAETVTGAWSFILQVTDSVGAAVNSSAVSVMVDAALVASAVTSSPSMVDQGQTSVLTSSSVTTGAFPYSYQWFEMAPGESVYSVIGGANLTSYSFVTSVSTDVGVWYFKLDVTDATGAVVTSNVGSVRVNLLPSVTISPSSAILDVGQPQLFTSSVINGTSPYYYQWYLDGVAVGTNCATWNFTFSSAGTFMVHLNVTDFAALFASRTATVVVKLHDVVVTNIMPSKTQIVEGDSINVNITVKNEGNYTETFNVTLYGNSLPIYRFTNVTLAPGSTTTLTIAGLHLGVGVHTLRANAQNAYVGGTFTGGSVWVVPTAKSRPRIWIFLEGGGYCARFLGSPISV